MEPRTNTFAVELRDIAKSFGDNEVLKGVNLRVPPGKTAVVMGGSGSGKSVLVKTIVKLIQPDSGTVLVNGIDISGLSENEMDAVRLNIGYLFQGGALFDSMSVRENMEFILERHADFDKGDRQNRIDELLEWVRLPEKADAMPSELSGGQRKRIALARAIVLKPSIVLYDEPTTGLDPESVRRVSDLIVKLRDEQGISSVAITHDLLCAELIADEVHFLYDGVIIDSGSLDEVSKSDHAGVRNFFDG